MKRLIGIILAVMMLTVSAACADTAVDVIMNTGTTQAFTDEAVAEEDLETILRAGLAAESAINQQPWFFVAVTNQEVMKEISGSGSGMGGGMGGFTPSAGMGDKPEGGLEGVPGGTPLSGNDNTEEGAPEGMPQDAPQGFPGGNMPEGAEGAEGGRPSAPSMGGGSGSKASLGDSPAAIIIYKSSDSKSPDASFDCGLAVQNMVIAASSLGYGVKIVSSPTMTLNGANHDALCEKLGVDPSMQAVAVLLIGKTDESVDAATGATTRDDFDAKTSIIK